MTKEIKKIIKILKMRIVTIKELSAFLWEQKIWWAIPIVFVLVIMALLFIAAGHSGMTAFIYPLF